MIDHIASLEGLVSLDEVSVTIKADNEKDARAIARRTGRSLADQLGQRKTVVVHFRFRGETKTEPRS